MFAETSEGAVQLISAVTGELLRTLVPAIATGGEGTGGRDFAVVGPSGHYVYYTDIDGAARVPLNGGNVEQLPVPPGHGFTVTSVFADRSDARFEETIGYAGDARPNEVYATRIGSPLVTDLGTGQAAGWSAAGAIAYVTTTAEASAGTATRASDLRVTITGVALAAPTARGFRETLPSGAPGDQGACGPPSSATAIGPTGQIGWVLGGCKTSAGGPLTYAFRSGATDRLVAATFPARDRVLLATSVQYTPAGTAVVSLNQEDCLGRPPVVVIRGNTNHAADLPSSSGRCG